MLQVFDLRNKLIAVSVPLAEVTRNLPLAPCPLLLTSYSLPLAPYSLPLALCSLPHTRYSLLVTSHPLLLTPYTFWQEKLAFPSFRVVVQVCVLLKWPQVMCALVLQAPLQHACMGLG